MNSDNENTVTYVNKGRCSKKIGFLLLSACEFFKAKYGLRIKAFYIADALSRGETPAWLENKGKENQVDFLDLIRMINKPLVYWKSIKNHF